MATKTARRSYVEQMQDILDRQRTIAEKEHRAGGIQFCFGLSDLSDEQIARNFVTVERARENGDLHPVSFDEIRL